MQTCGPLLARPQSLHDLIAELLSIDSDLESRLVESETAAFPENAREFLNAVRSHYADAPLAQNSTIASNEEITAAYERLLASFDRRTLYRSLTGIGRSGAERLDLLMGGTMVPTHPSLQALSARHACDPQSLCEEISDATGFRPTTIAAILIKAVSHGLLDPRTGLRPVPQREARVLDIPLQHSLFQTEQIELF